MTRSDHGPELLGTRLRHLLDVLDGGVAAVYADLGLTGFRPRYTPVVRALAASGPASVGEVAKAVGVTHSAASQTVAHLVKDGLVDLALDPADQRRRLARLTARAEALLPVLEAEWTATTEAARVLEAELPYPLSRLVEEALEALARRPMRTRVRECMGERPGEAEGP
ncbi:MarR family transcriptional regulator [Streptomyces roseolilacinus]|uniref:MarR family transcriptional regulator n=1 Tax=Streptomyces roseolilacinus TaxID=66904 RepID=A0A918B1B7_9ACTN|nr:helix-turn-helix domain-containing protein [Streptomyces roseolilacinus]GGQ12902.1 MarR family transcriptional regulator [Streptomyces roseolilacinus]